VLQCHGPRALVAAREFNFVRGPRKSRINSERLMNRDEYQALAHLRDAVEGRIQKRVRRSIAKALKSVADLLWYIVPTEVEDIWNILNEYNQRMHLSDVIEKSFVEGRSRVLLEGMFIAVDRAEF
jgi:hypothetical protein